MEYLAELVLKRMIKASLFVLFFISWGAHGLAEESGTGGGSSSGKRVILAQPLGFGPVPAFSSGLIAGFYLQPDLLLQFEVTKGWRIPSKSYSSNRDENGNGSSTSSINWDSEFAAYSLGAHAKYFLGKSFYAKGGLDYRSVRQADIHTNVLDTSKTFTVEFQGSALSLALAVGNQWQGSHFIFGVDWIGLVLPISSSASETFPSNSSEYGRQLTRDGETNYLKSSSAILCRVYLGTSF
jgi:hypothetical protein